MGVKNSPRLIEPDSSANSVKQRNPHHFLEFFEASGDGWLCDIEAFSSNRHAFSSRDLYESTYMAQAKAGLPTHNL